MDTTVFRTKLAATTKHLDDAGRHAETGTAFAFTAAAAELRRAAVVVDELVRLCAGDSQPQRRACPTCGKPGMAAARLCGYCWSKLTPIE